MAKPKLELRKKSESELALYVDSIITALTGNADFPTPVPPLAEVQARLEDYKTKHAEATAMTNAARLAVLAKEKARAELKSTVTRLAAYVESAAAGDASAILGTGMQVRQTGGHSDRLPAPANLDSAPGHLEGEIRLTWRGVPGAKTYEIAYKQHLDAAPWAHSKTATKRKASVPRLQPGVVYAFRVRAIGTAGEGAWSDETTQRAL